MVRYRSRDVGLHQVQPTITRIKSGKEGGYEAQEFKSKCFPASFVCPFDTLTDKRSNAYNAQSSATAMNFFNFLGFELFSHNVLDDPKLTLPCICGIHFPTPSAAAFRKMFEYSNEQMSYFDWVASLVHIDKASLEKPSTLFEHRAFANLGEAPRAVKPMSILEVKESVGSEAGPIIVGTTRDGKVEEAKWVRGSSEVLASSCKHTSSCC